MTSRNENPAGWAGRRGALAGSFDTEKTTTYHVDTASSQTLLDRLNGVQSSGSGWRARCPACGGSSRKVTIAEREGKVLLHCFGGCHAIDVLNAVGLSWADVMPPRHWTESPEERRQARRAIREAGWSSALAVLALEAKVILFAARELQLTGGLEAEDGKRLAAAVERIDRASTVLVEGCRR